jgi:hypothetical protein
VKAQVHDYSLADRSCTAAAIQLLARRPRPVRDSKDPDGPVLAFSLAEWRAFAIGVKAGEYDLS